KTKKLLDVAVTHGVTGVTMSNLTKQREKVEFLEPLPDSVKGGLSGAPLRERSTELVAKTYKAYGDELIIIGVGGVMSADDAYDKIKAGATFVELVTGLIMKGPFIEELNSGLVELLKKDGYSHISEAVGAGR
ncbi:dihydroorotate dehydrogenase (quinone), partial [Candidatus Saccharibacteria bacterium]|nr:dihydroorotate dehydrogenase (quinone) [Candidatus Saccharibacteria bacterium]